jgi:hypothetical protein
MESRHHGPRPYFSAVHALRFLELVAVRHYGRKELVDRLRIGEGSVRTIARMLESAGLIEVVRAGSRLTEKGRRFLDSIRTQISGGVAVPPSRASVDRYSIAVLVRGAGEMALSSAGIPQRDAAMMIGSRGASTMVYRSGRLVFPGMYEDLRQLDRVLADSLVDLLAPAEGDAIVLGSAADPDTANLGAIAAAATLLG